MAMALESCDEERGCMRISMELSEEELYAFEATPQKFLVSQMRSGEPSFGKLNADDR